MGAGTGGVAALNRRLMATNPPGPLEGECARLSLNAESRRQDNTPSIPVFAKLDSFFVTVFQRVSGIRKHEVGNRRLALFLAKAHVDFSEFEAERFAVVLKPR